MTREKRRLVKAELGCDKVGASERKRGVASSTGSDTNTVVAWKEGRKEKFTSSRRRGRAS